MLSRKNLRFDQKIYDINLVSILSAINDLRHVCEKFSANFDQWLNVSQRALILLLQISYFFSRALPYAFKLTINNW